MRSSTLGDACRCWGWVAELADVLRGSLLPLLMPLVLPPDDLLVGVTWVGGCLKGPSLVDVRADDLDFDLMLSSFTSSSSNAWAYFFDMILKRSFFYARRPSFCRRRPFLRFLRYDIGRPRIKSVGTSIDFISDNFEAFTGGK